MWCFWQKRLSRRRLEAAVSWQKLNKELTLVMTKITKSLLGLSIVGIGSGLVFVSGLINVQDKVAYYVSLPAGAIFFGLFLISLMLEKESAAYDAEQRKLLDLALRADPRPVDRASQNSNRERKALATANAR